MGGDPYVPYAAGTYDTFLINSGTDRITMTFSGFLISQVSFDYEIFPNGECPNWNNCGPQSNPQSKLPDFKFEANDVLIFQEWGVVPGTNGTYEDSPLTDGTTPTLLQKTELAPQLLGTGTWTFTTPVSKLEFIDWPSTIGIDNLTVTIHQTPEPGSVLLLGTVAAGVLYGLRKRRAA